MTKDNGEWHILVSLEDIPPGQMLAREIGDVHVALYNVAGEIFATDNVCSHAFALLTDGWLDDDVIECPLHGAQFNVCTGKALSEPADIDLRTFQVRVVDGKVEVLLA